MTYKPISTPATTKAGVAKEEKAATKSKAASLLAQPYVRPAPRKATDPGSKPNTFLLVGPARSGKTSQIWTMPKPAMVIGLDPNTTSSIDGCPDTHYWEFPIDSVPMAPKTGKHTVEARQLESPPQAYLNFWRFLRSAKEDNLFANYKTVLFDGITMLEAIATDVVLYDLGMLDKSITKEEATTLRSTIMAALRELTSVVSSAHKAGANPQNLIVTAHQADRVDRSGAVIGSEISAYGKLRQFIPANFSHIFYVKQKGDSQKAKYMAQTRGDSMITDVGTSFRGLPYKIDLTISDFTKPEKYGLGKMLKCMETGKPWKD